MVERVAPQGDFGNVQRQGYQQTGIGFKQQQVQQPVESQLDRTLQNILGAGIDFAEKGFQRSTEEAYLDGAAKVGQIQSEAELQGDPLTRDWAVAGYRDTMGRLKLADSESKVAADMSSMREKSPEEFQKYLATQRAELTPALNGMSFQQRQATLGQVLLNEQASIKKHTAEHSKFIVEQEVKSIQTGMSVQVQNLNAAKGDGSAYAAATDATFGSLVGSIWQNPKLSEEMRLQLTGEAAKYALSSDNLALYEKMRNTEITFADGSTGTLMNRLPWDEQVKIANDNRESLKRTEVFRSADFEDEMAKRRASWDDPNTPLEDHRSIAAFLQYGREEGFVDVGKTESIMKEYYTKAAQKATSADLASAFAAGDQGKIFAKGKTVDEAMNAWVSQAVKGGKPMGTVVQQLMAIGNNTGQGAAFQKVGELMKPAIAQLGQNNKIDPNNAAMVKRVLAGLDAAERTGHEGAYSNFMSSFDQGSQDKLMYIREGLRSGMDVNAALAQAQSNMINDQKIPPDQRKAIQSSMAKENAAMVNELEAKTVFGRAWQAAKGLISGDAAATQAIGTKRAFFENDDRVNAALAQTKLAFAEELSIISRNSPTLSADSRRSRALSAVVNRTVQTSSGPMIVPRGTNVQKFFNAPAQASADRIGLAMDEFIKPSRKENRLAYSVTPQGQVMYKEFNQNGQLARSGVINPKSIGPLVQHQWDREAQRYRATSGDGVSRRSGNIQLQYNGENTAMVDPSVMLQFRDNLYKHEGVSDRPYRDLSGKVVDGKPVMTAGVGVSSHNPYYPKAGPDGRISSAAIRDSFMRASDQAAQSAQQIMRNTGLRGNASFLMLSELAYQSGTGFTKMPVYKELLQKVRQKDAQGAQAVLQRTPAYQWTKPGSDRRKFYENTLNQMLR